MAFSLVTIALASFLAMAQSESINDITTLNQMMNDVDDEFSPRVIEGRDAVNKEFPWMVSLHYLGTFICSSFLISPKFLMTAAHCVIIFEDEPVDPKEFSGYVGTIARDGPGTEVKFSEIIAHKEYKMYGPDDIALMRLDKPVALNDAIQTVCLPTKNAVYEDMTAQIMGWGPVTRNGESAETLQTATVNILANSMCVMRYALLGISVTNRHVCAGGDSNKGICEGDMGGPLVALNETKPIAIGVASFLYRRCAQWSIPAVFTRTASYVDWVRQQVGEEDATEICFLKKSNPPCRWG